jgi:hypothetical protein
MAKVDDPVAFEGRFGFIVRQDNNSIAASFSFETKEDADAAHQKMKEILATCLKVTGYA